MKQIFPLKLAALLITMLLGIACNDESQEPQGPQEPQGSILPSLIKDSLETLSIKQYLGLSYHIGNTIIGDPKNVAAPVINVEKLYEAHPSYFMAILLASSNTGFCAYSDYDRYGEWAQIAWKEKTNFELNPDTFRIIRENIGTDLFVDKLASTGKSVYGEAWQELQYKKHQLNSGSNVKQKIAADFLDEDFLNTLFNHPTADVLQKYGPFVLTKIYSGKRISSLYYGITKKEDTPENKEKDMKSQINALLGEAETINAEFEAVYYSLKTSEDDPDLSTNSQEAYTMSGIMNNGLVPLADFVLEKSIKDLFYRHLKWGETISSFREPNITIVRDVPLLVTRSGQWIILNSTAEQMQTIVEDKQQYYHCAYAEFPDGISEWTQKDIIPREQEYHPEFWPISFYDFSAMDESRMLRYKNPNTNMWYIYDPVAKVALSYYKDDYILDVYGMKHWVTALPQQAISMEELARSYKIVAL